MFHVKQAVLFFSFFSALCLGVSPQKGLGSEQAIVPIYIVQDSLMRHLQSLNGFDKLSLAEQEAMYFLNLARTEPKVYLSSILLPYLKDSNEPNNWYTKSLVDMLQSMEPVGIIKPNTPLLNIAASHAKELAKGNDISHNSADGRDPFDRMGVIGIQCGAECIHKSTYSKVSDMVLSLLIDKDIPDLGHRKSMLSKDYKSAGLSIVPSAGNSHVLVLDMSCK